VRVEQWVARAGEQEARDKEKRARREQGAKRAQSRENRALQVG
jgi:hypothetical protein